MISHQPSRDHEEVDDLACSQGGALPHGRGSVGDMEPLNIGCKNWPV